MLEITGGTAAVRRQPGPDALLWIEAPDEVLGRFKSVFDAQMSGSPAPAAVRLIANGSELQARSFLWEFAVMARAGMGLPPGTVLGFRTRDAACASDLVQCLDGLRYDRSLEDDVHVITVQTARHRRLWRRMSKDRRRYAAEQAVLVIRQCSADVIDAYRGSERLAEPGVMVVVTAPAATLDAFRRVVERQGWLEPAPRLVRWLTSRRRDHGRNFLEELALMVAAGMRVPKGAELTFVSRSEACTAVLEAALKRLGVTHTAAGPPDRRAIKARAGCAWHLRLLARLYRRYRA